MQKPVTSFIGLIGSAFFLTGSVFSIISNANNSNYWGTAGAVALAAIFLWVGVYYYNSCKELWAIRFRKNAKND